MKQFILILLSLNFVACHQENSPWPYEGDRQPVNFQISATGLSDFNTIPSQCLLYFYDSLQGITEQQTVTRQGSLNLFQAHLFPGSYTGYCITNADSPEYWQYQAESTPEEILLKTQTQGGSRDHMYGYATFQVRAGDSTCTLLPISRKVARLLIVTHNQPDWLTDLQIKIERIPRHFTLSGQYSSTTQSIYAQASPAINGMSTTQLLVFPPTPGRTCKLILSSDEHRYLSDGYTIDYLTVDQTTRIDITFSKSDRLSVSSITSASMTWNKEIIADEWDTETPEPYIPCEGTGKGMNQIKNASFEEQWNNGLPNFWKLNGSGHDKLIKRVMVPVHHGRYAVQLNGSTYLYQDINIYGGQCYQLNMYVNAPNDSIKWRCWCTWMKGSTALSSFSKDIRSSAYRHQTDGYIDALQGIAVRAPQKATRLRVEIRTYQDTPTEGEGLYVDDFNVQEIF